MKFDFQFELFGDSTDNCQRTAMAFEEAGVPYLASKVHLRRGDHLSLEHAARNADRKVPTLAIRQGQEEPLYISQSNAIMLFLDGLVPGKLLPAESLSRAAALETYTYFVTEVAALTGVARHLRGVNALGVAAGVETWAAERFTHAGRFLEASPYFTGEQFGLSDIVALTLAYDLQDHIAWDKSKRLSGWFASGKDRLSFKQSLMAFD